MMESGLIAWDDSEKNTKALCQVGGSTAAAPDTPNINISGSGLPLGGQGNASQVKFPDDLDVSTFYESRVYKNHSNVLSGGGGAPDPISYTGLLRLAVQAKCGAGRHFNEDLHPDGKSNPVPLTPTVHGIIKHFEAGDLRYWLVGIDGDFVNIAPLKFDGPTELIRRKIADGDLSFDEQNIFEAYILAGAKLDYAKVRSHNLNLTTELPGGPITHGWHFARSGDKCAVVHLAHHPTLPASWETKCGEITFNFDGDSPNPVLTVVDEGIVNPGNDRIFIGQVLWNQYLVCGLMSPDDISTRGPIYCFYIDGGSLGSDELTIISHDYSNQTLDAPSLPSRPGITSNCSGDGIYTGDLTGSGVYGRDYGVGFIVSGGETYQTMSVINNYAKRSYTRELSNPVNLWNSSQYVNQCNACTDKRYTYEATLFRSMKTEWDEETRTLDSWHRNCVLPDASSDPDFVLFACEKNETSIFSNWYFERNWTDRAYAPASSTQYWYQCGLPNSSWTECNGTVCVDKEVTTYNGIYGNWDTTDSGTTTVTTQEAIAFGYHGQIPAVEWDDTYHDLHNICAQFPDGTPENVKLLGNYSGDALHVNTDLYNREWQTKDGDPSGYLDAGAALFANFKKWVGWA